MAASSRFLYAFVFLFVAAHGAGAYSVEALMHRPRCHQLPPRGGEVSGRATPPASCLAWAALRAGQLLIAVGVLVRPGAALDVLADEPLRARSSGASTSARGLLGAAGRRRLSPVELLDVELDRLVVRQEANPEPAVLDFPAWSAACSGRRCFVCGWWATAGSTRPASTSTPSSSAHERRDDVAMKDRGWQDALRGDLSAEDQRVPHPRRRRSLTWATIPSIRWS